MSQMGLRTPFLLGDGTPDYIYREESLKALKNYMPDAKIIILVRDPIKRSFSYFQHETRAGRINKPFDELIDYEYKQFIEKGILFHEDLYEHPQLKDTFLLGSLYSEYIELLLKHYSKKQVLLISSEKLFSEPEVVYNNVLNFINIKPYKNTRFKVFNSGNYNFDRIPESEFLSKFYAPYNTKLESIVDMKFNWK